MVDFNKGFTVDDFDAFEEYMGTIFHKILVSNNLTNIKTVVELAPGYRYKIAWALAQINFSGTLYVIDSNQNVLSYIKEEYKKRIPNANIVCVNKTLVESVEELPEEIDLFLSNHCLDDLVIAEYLDKQNLKVAFNNSSDSKNLLVKSWEDLSDNPLLLAEIKDKVLSDWIEFFESINIGFIIINQYISGYYVKEKKVIRYY